MKLASIFLSVGSKSNECMYRKFIITDDGVLRLGRASQHRDLLEWGEECTCGGGFWRVDDGRGLVILYGRSFNFGAPVIGHVRCVEWVGVPPIELPVFYLAEWPHDGIMIPVIY